jgi:hypothetical protein
VSDNKVKGYCPMGCGQTLFIASGTYITCLWIDCPRPDAVADLLEDREREHVVVLTKREFTVRHPLRERLDDELLTCDLHKWIASRSGPPAALGRYRVYWPGSKEGGVWEELS